MGSRATLSQAYYDLATMIDAGMPILRTLDIIVEGRQGYLKRVFSQIRAAVGKGSSLSEALEEHPRVFSEMDRMLVDAAETSGSLSTSFSMLSEWHQFVHRIICRILAGLVYPFLILHAGAFVANVPGAVLGGATIQQYLWSVAQLLLIFYIPAAVIIALLLLQKRSPLLRWPLDYLALRIPVLGLALYHISVCRYAKAFGMLYGAGVPISETVERANRVTGNVIVARLFEGAEACVRAGGMPSEGFSKRLPSEYRQLWQIGEETGDLDKTTAKVAEIAGDRADLYFTTFARWMPIFIYVLVAIFLIIQIFGLFQRVYGNLLNS